MLRDHPHSSAGPRRAEGGGDGGPGPPGGRVQHPVWRRQQVVIPPTIYEKGQALGYHHPRDLYTADHRVAGDWALKERAFTRRGIPSLRAWLARHSAVLVPILRAPTPQWQAAPKNWIPDIVPPY